MATPQSHVQYLRTEFKPAVSLETYTAEEQRILKKYGSWLRALMLGDIEPVTEEETYFVRMCHGEEHPRTEIHAAWKKYQLDLMYDVASHMDEHIGTHDYPYSWVVTRFTNLAQQGHRRAVEWLEREGQQYKVPDSPPLIDIARIYPKRQGFVDIFETGRIVPGSFESAHR